MARIPRPADIFAELRDIKRRLRVLESTNRLTSASVKNGQIQVFGDDGAAILYVGKFPYGGGTAAGLGSARADGTTIFAAGEFPSPVTSFVVNDLHGMTLFATDEVDGGLVRPYLPMPMYPIGDTNRWPAISSGTFSALWVADLIAFQGAAAVAGLAQCTGTAVGAIQVFVNGVAFGSPVSIPNAGTTTFVIDGIDLRPALGTEAVVSLAARVTSGAGTVIACPQATYTKSRTIT